MSTFFKTMTAAGVVGQALLLALLLGAALGTSACRQRTPEERLMEARQLLQERQIPLAVRRIQDIIAEHPDEDVAIDARFVLAEIYLSLGREDSLRNAIEQLQAVADRTTIEDPAGQQALSTITEIYLMLGERERAIENSASIVEKAQGVPVLEGEARLLHNILLLSVGEDEQLEEARAFLRNMVTEAPQEPIRHQAREILADHFRRLEKYEESNEVYQLFLDSFPDDPVNPQILMAQALNLRSAGDEEAAEELFAEGEEALKASLEEVEDANRRADILSNLSQFYDIFDKPDRAEEMLRRIMAEQPATLQAINAQFGIGQLFFRRGEFEKAIEHYRQMARENPDTHIEQTAMNWVRMLETAVEEGLELEDFMEEAPMDPSLAPDIPMDDALPQVDPAAPGPAVPDAPEEAPVMPQAPGTGP